MYGSVFFGEVLHHRFHTPLQELSIILMHILKYFCYIWVAEYMRARVSVLITPLGRFITALVNMSN